MIIAEGSRCAGTRSRERASRPVFHAPDEETLAITDSLGQSKKIKLITVRHEQVAAFMAGVYALQRPVRPGVCLAILGHGAMNLARGIADASVDRAQLMVLTGQAELEYAHKKFH